MLRIHVYLDHATVEGREILRPNYVARDNWRLLGPRDVDWRRRDISPDRVSLDQWVLSKPSWVGAGEWMIFWEKFRLFEYNRSVEDNWAKRYPRRFHNSTRYPPKLRVV
jgi:hypothetical protein